MNATSSFKTDGWTITLPERHCPQPALLIAAKALNHALLGNEWGLFMETAALQRLGFHVLSFEAAHETQPDPEDFMMWAWFAKQHELVHTYALAALKSRIWPGMQFSNRMAGILEIEPEGSRPLSILSDLVAEYLRWMCEVHGAECLLNNRAEAVMGPRGEAMLVRICGQVLSAKEAAALDAATPHPGASQTQGRRRL